MRALISSFCFIGFLGAAPAEGQVASPKPALVSFESPESVLRLERSRHKADFFRLVNQFEPQANKGFCGPASAVIVLNALRVFDAGTEKPRDTSSVPAEVTKNLPPNFDPFLRRYTQKTFFDERFERGKPAAVFYGRPPAPGERPDPGLQIGQLAKILEAHGLSVVLRIVADDGKEAELKREILSNLSTADDYVIINYHREALGQTGGGHISPLGAYDQGSDSFLILDVNATAQRWVWVPSAALFAAMRTRDRDQNRGFIVVREAASP